MDTDETAALQLLERLVVGEGLPADKAALEVWIGNDPNRQRMVERLQARWGGVPDAYDVNAGWERMVRRHLRRRPVAIPARRSAFRAAAAAGAAAAVVTLAFWLGKLPTRTAEPPAPRVHVTAAGQRADFRLSDGTRVVIAPESRVRVAADFGAPRRDVYVEGEAYFEVAHDSTRPFTVFAANSSTHDIGTAFAVRSYAEERAVRVVVTEGKVVMSGAGPLVAGDVGHLTAEGSVSVRRGVDVHALVGWTRGELTFEDAPLGDVLRDLRRWYGIDVHVADSTLTALPFTGSLRGASSTQSITLVAATLGLRVTQKNGQFILGKR